MGGSKTAAAKGQIPLRNLVADRFEAGSKLVADRFEAKFHYAILSQTGSKLVADLSQT